MPNRPYWTVPLADVHTAKFIINFGRFCDSTSSVYFVVFRHLFLYVGV